MAPLSGYIKFLGYFWGYYVIFRCVRTSTERSCFFQFFTWGAVSFVLLFAIFFWKNLGSEGGGRWEVFVDGKLLWDPNALGIFSFLCFYASLLACYYTHEYILKICYLIFCGLFIFIIFMAQSRTPLGAIVFGIAIGLALKWKYYIPLILGLALLIVGLWSADIKVNDIMPRRFTMSQALEDRAAGRTEVWRDYIEYATLSDWLIGRGCVAKEETILYQKPLREMRGLGRLLGRLDWNPAGRIYATHNTYIQIALLLGIGGVVFFALLFFAVTWGLLKGVIRDGICWIYLSMWLSLLIYFIFGDILFTHFFLFFVVVSLSQIS